MMGLRLYVLQHQWIVMTLVAAVAAVLAFCLTYQALWTPRGTEGKSERIEVKDLRTFFLWLSSFMPWVVVLVVVLSAAFTVVKVLENTRIPPNW